METCKHCGRDLRDAGTPHMNGTYLRWVHDAWGGEICEPASPRTSQRAEPAQGRPTGFYPWGEM